MAQPCPYWEANPELVNQDLRERGFESDNPTAPFILERHVFPEVASKASRTSAAGSLASRYIQARMSELPRSSLASTQQPGTASRLWPREQLPLRSREQRGSRDK